jgi:hypothetical protein
LITPVQRTDPQSIFYCKRILRCKKNAHNKKKKKKKKGVKEEEEVRMLCKLAKEIHPRLQKTNKNLPGSGILSQDQSGRRRRGRRRRSFCGGSFRGSCGKEDCSCKIAAEIIVVIVNCKFDEKKQQLLTLICRRKQVSSQG